MTTKHIPLRKCVACGESKPKGELWRVVLTDEKLILDKTGRLNGRGAYICRNKECLELAVRRKGFDKSFRMTVPKEFYESLEGEISNEE